MIIDIGETYPGSNATFKVDNIEYEVYISDRSNVAGYANVVVKDGKTGEKFYCNGILEINDHQFTFKWKDEYNNNRDNWVCGSTLLVYVI